MGSVAGCFTTNGGSMRALNKALAGRRCWAGTAQWRTCPKHQTPQHAIAVLRPKGRTKCLDKRAATARLPIAKSNTPAAQSRREGPKVGREERSGKRISCVHIHSPAPTDAGQQALFLQRLRPRADPLPPAAAPGQCRAGGPLTCVRLASQAVSPPHLKAAAAALSGVAGGLAGAFPRCSSWTCLAL